MAGKLVGFAGSTAHAPDIGGKVRSPEPREVFEEGLQIPIMKAVRAGEPDATLFRILRQNVRTPDETIGDLWAQLTALDLMESRVAAAMEEYGQADLAALASEIQGRSEVAMRAAIRAVPDGVYENVMPTDGGGARACSGSLIRGDLLPGGRWPLGAPSYCFSRRSLD